MDTHGAVKNTTENDRVDAFQGTENRLGVELRRFRLEETISELSNEDNYSYGSRKSDP